MPRRPIVGRREVSERRKGWLYRAVEPLLPDWNSYDAKRRSAPTVKGVVDEYHSDPRFSAKQWTDNDGNLTLMMMVGNDHSRGGQWIAQSYTPEQCVQIVAAILSKPAIEKVVGPLLDALRAPSSEGGAS